MMESAVSCEIINIIREVRTAVASYYAKRGEKIVSFTVPQTFSRPFSHIAFYNISTTKCEYRLVSKTVVHHEINEGITRSQNQAVIEYNILNELYPNFETVPACSVPQPVLVIPHLETYVMCHVEGVVLSDSNKYCRFMSSTAGLQTLEAHYRSVGRWLKHFQQFTKSPDQGPAVLNGVLERCQSRLRLLKASGDLRCPPDFDNKVMAHLNRLVGNARGSVSVAGRHGDFTPWNVLAGKGGITVIDFMGYDKEPLFVDYFKMLIYLEDEALSFTSSRQRVHRLRQQFLDGYGPALDTSNTIALVCEIMQRVVSMWACVSRPVKFPHHRWEANVRFSNHLNRVLEKITIS